MSEDRLLVQIASYNTNLQAERGLPQDLVDWLAPTLQVSKFLAREPRAPDIVAVGFQELLPLHLGCTFRRLITRSVRLTLDWDSGRIVYEGHRDPQRPHQVSN